MSRVVEVSFTPLPGPADFLAAVERQQRICQAIDDYHRGGDVVAAIERHERAIKRLEDFRRGAPVDVESSTVDRLQALTESLRRHPLTNR